MPRVQEEGTMSGEDNEKDYLGAIKELRIRTYTEADKAGLSAIRTFIAVTRVVEEAKKVGADKVNIAEIVQELAAETPKQPPDGRVRISDIRLKRDIVQLERLDNGIGIYRFRYLNDDPELYVGVMAQEVQFIVPSAVLRYSDGYLRVDYEHLGLQCLTWKDWIAKRAGVAR
jgi:hypothetical protein